MIITVSAFLYTHFTVKLASFVGILDHKNILTRKIKTQIFYNTKITRHQAAGQCVL